MSDETPSSPEAPASEAVPRLSRFARREIAAADALRTLIRDFISERFPRAEDLPGELPLKLEVMVRPGEDWRVTWSPSLQEQLAAQVEDLDARCGVYQEGCVYNFRSGSTTEPSCRPPDPGQVFAGYDSTGVPQWKDFMQVLIDARDARVDQLFGERAPVLQLLQFGKELKQEQLGSFGKSSRSYALLGQIVLGYLKAVRREDPRLALTFQVVEGRDEKGELMLRINTLAGGREGLAEELLHREVHAWIYRAREGAQRELDKIATVARLARAHSDREGYQAAMKRVGRVLRKLAQSLERGDRQTGRRTRHAETRRSQDRRPVHKAVDDIQRAASDAFYYDEKHSTFVVRGKNNRAHAFSPEGRQVTSFTIQGDAVDFRVRTRRWRPATPDERTQLLEQIAAGTGKAG